MVFVVTSSLARAAPPHLRLESCLWEQCWAEHWCSYTRVSGLDHILQHVAITRVHACADSLT